MEYFILEVLYPLFALLIAFISARLGYWRAKKTTHPCTLFRRYLPKCAPLFVLILMTIPLFLFVKDSFGRAILIVIAPMLWAWLWLPYFLGFIFGSRHNPSTDRLRGIGWLGAIFFLVTGASGLNFWNIERQNRQDHYFYEAEVDSNHGVKTEDYMPFTGHSNKLKTPDKPPSLRIEKNHPRLDGAIAAVPVYGAVAKAIYADIPMSDNPRDFKSWEVEGGNYTKGVVACTNTPNALSRLQHGDADIFFGIAPSEEQLADLAKEGLTPVITPIAREAFVFMVHKENPVQNLSLAQIQAIYTKKVTNWQEIGGPDAQILPYQRPNGSGSQSAMEDKVMQGLVMAEPLTEERGGGMGGIIKAVAEYRNKANSLGYTFLWFATEQFPSKDIRFLAVDNVLPSEENIRNGSYPLTVNLVAITARPLSEESKALLEWITGSEGQALIAKVGYAPLRAKP